MIFVPSIFRVTFLWHYKTHKLKPTKIFFPVQRIGGVGLCCLWQNLYVMSSSHQRKGKGLKGGTVLGVLRFFQFLKQFTGDTSRFLRILFLVFLIFEYSQAAMVMPWRMTLPASTFGMFRHVFIFYSHVWISYISLAIILERVWWWRQVELIFV